MHPTISEKAILYTMWKEAFGFDDGGSIDDYFDRNFKLEHCYIQKDQDTIIACLCAHPHRMILHDKEVPVLFISGVITHPKYRHIGHMRNLFEEVFQAHPECPLWVLQAYEPKIYTSLGFQVQYHQKTYSIPSLPFMNHPIVQDLQPSEMASLANTVLKQFDGYFKRDEFWYQNYLLEARAQSQRIYGIRKDNTLLGYAKDHMEDGICHIDELLYHDTDSRNALFAYAGQNQFQLSVDSFITYEEPWSYEEHQVLMVKLGNLDALKNIFQRNVNSIEDVFLNTKPLYHYGFW